jgi:hypothetical protein
MGVGIVVNLREDHTEVATAKREVESLEMKSIGIPWNAIHEPSSTQRMPPQIRLLGANGTIGTRLRNFSKFVSAKGKLFSPYTY